MFCKLNHLLISCSVSLILYNSCLASAAKKYFDNESLIDFSFWCVQKKFSALSSIVFVCFLAASSIAFVLLKLFLKEKSKHSLFYNLTLIGRYYFFACKIFIFMNFTWWNDIFAASLLKLYCSFQSLILWPIAMISFYIPSKRFFLKRKGLFDARVISITKKYGSCSTLSVKIHKVFKVNIWWIIKCNLLRLLFVWNFCNKKCVQFSLTPFATEK